MNLLSKPATRNGADAKRALLEERLRKVAAEPEIVPLSFAQQRLWVIDQLEPNSPLYNVPVVVQLTGGLDVDALQRAFEALIDRHEILRTRFICLDERPVQAVEAEVDARMVLHDLTPLPAGEQEAAARRLVQAEVNRPFDLSACPLIRLMLLRLAPEEHRLVLNIHHVVSDEWSLRICFRDLAALYGSFREKETPALPELPVQYADYALWQRDWLKGGILEKQLAYWRQQLQGNPPVLELTTDRPRPAVPTFRGGSLSRPLAVELSGALKDLAARHGASLFMVLLAAFKTLLHRYTQQSDILVGSPIAGRSRVETEELIGFFVNTLILRTDLSGNPSFEDLLRRIRETTLGAYAHQDLPFERLVEELRPERTLNHMPFSHVMFALQNTGLEEMVWPGLKLRVLEVQSDTAKFDLTFAVAETRRGLVARAEFNKDLFDEDSIARQLEHFEILLKGIVANPRCGLADLPLMSDAERQQVLVDWNATDTEFPREESIQALFEAQVERAPDAVGLVFGKTPLTWREINSRANQLAHYLKKYSVRPNVPVGLCMERSAEMVIAMVAILKAGGAYVPLDPSYPKPRLAFMLNDSRAPVLLTQQKLVNQLPRTAARVICFDSDWDVISRESRANLPNDVNGENLAYVIYTSGSTGQPKGVAVPHRAVIRLVRNTNYIQLTSSDRIAQASNASFDAATFEIWGALLNGAQLVGISKDVALSPADFAQELREHKISALFLTTALFNQLAAEAPQALAGIRVVMFGGEAVDTRSVRAALQDPPQHLLHVYGPTENTTFSTWHEVRTVPDGVHTIPIGRPISNTQCYILDRQLKPVPIGVPGELHLAGDGLADGYCNQPDLSAQKFIPNPFTRGHRPSLLYKTGDLTRWRPDGTIEFISRMDQQVKIRGFRIELGEIEIILGEHAGVRNCVVAVHEDGTGDKRLAAYFVPSGKRVPGVSELRQFVRDRLPDYMVPSAFVHLDSIPLTPNGKVDRKALPEPGRARPDLEKRYATPEDAVEVELTRIWETVLGVHPVGVEDKFFELGGHSLLAVRVIAQIEKAFGRKLRLATIFQAQTIAQLAAILRKEIHEDSALSGTSLVEIQPKGTHRPLFFVHGAGGGMFWGYVNLSRHLGQDQPVFGLRSRGLDGREEFKTIEAMAAQYVSDIRALQPHGPYRVGGYCFGGNVAYEMACQLRQQGEEIESLALFNCSPANSRYSRLSCSPRWVFRFLVNLRYWIDYFLTWNPAQRREFFRWKREMFERRVNRLMRRPSGDNTMIDAREMVDLSSFSAEQRKLWEHHIRALMNYHPRPYAGKVHLFRSPGHPLLCSFDTDYGWGDLARGGVEINIVPGVHEKILEDPCVPVLARGLKTLLESNAGRYANGNGCVVERIPQAKVASNGAGKSEPPLPIPATRKDSVATDPLESNYACHFETQVRRNPGTVALRFRDEELNYAELNQRANRLARHLQSLGVGPEVLVGVCLERSLDLPMALLAVLKAGGAYVPLDSSYPKARLAYMLEDSRARVLLTQSQFLDALNTEQLQTVCLDDPDQIRQIAEQSPEDPKCQAGPDHLAYVIYTSGSTGTPKGVEITHRALLNHNFAVARAFELRSDDRVLQFSPFSFDISVEEIFPSWLAGCALVLRGDETISSIARFLEFVARERLTVLNIPTAYWQELTEFIQTATLPDCVRLVVIGGEKASDETWRRWAKRAGDKVALINAYGPTETTVTATMHRALPADERLSIGRPIANTQVYILDDDFKPVPAGTVGELFIGGTGLARGYFNRPELTAEKFIRNPWDATSPQRLYRTGDLARLLENGDIEFIGRADQQIKIRGYRIEPGEVEAVLSSHPAVKEAVVAAPDSPLGKRLVAYFVSRNGSASGVSELRNFLKSKLPPHMIPAFLVSLPSLPLTAAGKVDRQSLPAPGNARPELDQPFVAPRTLLEEVIAGIWCEVLGLDRVGVHDNFFDLGGHSLLGTQVIARVREALHTEIPLASLFSFPTIATLAERLQDSGAQKQPVLPASALASGERLPLTGTQQRIWFLDSFEPHQSPYNIATCFRLKGALDIAALERSLTELARRHEALRALFPAEDGQPVQIVPEPREIHLPIIDVSGVAETERESRALSVAIDEGKRAYVMSHRMIRPVLIRLAPGDHLLLFTTHEIACDAWSVRLLFRELTVLYESFVTSQTVSLPPVECRYSEVAGRLQLPADRAAAQLEYWSQRLKGAPALLELPADRPRPPHKSDVGARERVLLSKEVTLALEELSRVTGSKPFVVLLAVFQSLLSRYTGGTDILVGSTASNRRNEFNSTVGKLDNIVVLRGDLSGDPTFLELLERTRQLVDGALVNSDLPFDRVLAELGPPRNASYTPIYQVAFEYQEEGLPGMDAAGLQFVPVDLDNQTAQLDLKLRLARTPEGLTGSIEYSTSLFDASRVTRMTEHFGTLLESAVANPGQRISVLPLLSARESQMVLVDWNATQKDYPIGMNLARLVEAQVERTPDATALVAGRERLTYRELNSRANQLANHLQSLGVKPETLVGVCMERSTRLLVAILAVLKSGGAYVPLDPAYPKDRLAFILDDAKAPVLLTQQSLASLCPPGTTVVCLDSDWDRRVASESRENPSATADPAGLAYVIYTSGSTGRPKGVALEHRNAVALIHWARDVFTDQELAGVLASTSICFDLSVFEMFVPLSWGGCVILAENAIALAGLPAREEVTLINTVPSAISELIRIKGVPPSVRVVNLAGEPLTTPLVNRIHAGTHAEKVYDLYGPSETTTYSTFTLRQPNLPATIGSPLTNEEVYLLDRNQQPVPIGIPGELYIGGVGVGRGYLNRPELTAEKFVTIPLRPGKRLYRTGDLARWRSDGKLEFLGRIDHQVKIRGFRIELGEVESVLRKHPGLSEAVVLAREDQSGSKRLVGYVVPRSGVRTSTEELRRFARESLPDYMVPSVVVILEAMPLTPNGKVDRKALPEPKADRRDTGTAFVAARTPVEQQLSAIWREVLRLDRIGVRDNFFELGGHSLLAIQVISRVRETLKVELPLFSLFEAPTIELIAKGLDSGEWTGDQVLLLPLQPVPRDGRLPVSFVQERLWFLDQLEPGNHAYNVPMALRLKGPLDVQSLRRAFDEVIRRHEALRTTFAYRDGELIQIVASTVSVDIEPARLDSTPVEERESRLRSWLNEGAQRPFDLSAGPLIRVLLARLSDAEHALLVVMHHTVSDGWSLTILFQELERFYNAFAEGKPAPVLDELTVQYADFASWKRRCMEGSVLDKEMRFWKEKLKDAPECLDFPTDHPVPENSTGRADRQVIEFSTEMAEALTTLSHRENSTPFVILMGALAIVLGKWTRQQDLVIGTVVAGRTHREMESVIGCFMNFLAIRIQTAGSPTVKEFLAKVKTAVLEVQAHQDCPFEKVVEAVNPKRRLNQNPLYNVALLLQNFPAEMFKSPCLQVNPLPVEMHAALLDLRFEAELTAQGMSLACEYRTDLFDAATIEQLLTSYRQILETVIGNSGARLSEFRITEALARQAESARRRKERLTLAIAATFTAEPVEEPLRYWLQELELPSRIEFAPFNQVFQQLLDPSSSISSNVRGMNVVLVRLEDWLPRSTGADPKAEIDRSAGEFVAALKTATARASTPFVVFFCPASAKVTADPEIKALLDRVEANTAAELEKVGGVQPITIRELMELYPVADYDDPSGDELGRVPYTPLFFSALGTMIARKLHATQRAPHKVIVLDCDQTLWAGVCGEDGVAGICLDEPRKALQEFMRAQHDAGMLLATCSKNNEDDVREVFARRTEMPLRHEHFAAWRVNWRSKSENLKSLAEELNLGLDSFIFVDDNPVECAEVEANCPEVLTLQLPEDPAQIPQFLKHCWVFDHLKLTAEDRKRGEMYRSNRQREKLRTESMSLGDFLSGLDLKIQIDPMSAEQLPRVAQLTHRTNQFNCTTIRRSEAEMQRLADTTVLTVSVRDRFGDYGLVGVMICERRGKTIDVETFLLSCRVLGRGVEHRMLARLGQMALNEKRSFVDVHFHPSAKNKPAFDFLQSVGGAFQQALNGGYVYRFPALAAAKVAFNPKSFPARVPSAESRRRPTETPDDQFRLGKFERCREIALTANEASRIHQAIEARASAHVSRPNREASHTPPRTEMERRLCAVWEKLLRMEKVGVNDDFFDLGGHSLLAVRLFAEVEKLVGRKLPLVTIFQAPTIEQLARILGDRDAVASRSPLVPVQPNGSRPPLFLVHGAGGDVLWGYANLAKYMPPDQPIHGIKSRGQIGLEEYTTIPEMARFYLEEIRAFQPEGPYFIGGYCLGGNIAYEMARQLHQQGERVALLALLDSFPSNAGYERVAWWRPGFPFRFGRNFYYWLQDFADLTSEERRRFIARKARTIGRKLAGKFKRRNGAAGDDVDLEEVIDFSYFPEHELRFWQIHLRALTKHVEQPYPGPVTLIRTRGQPLWCSLEEDFCWSKLAKGGAMVNRIPGSHENIFMEPHVRTLAEQLERCLAEARTKEAAPSKERCAV